jgi:hypothetical protein
MNKESVLELKRDVMKSLTRVVQGRGPGLQGLASPQEENRLAVGYSHLGKGSYRLELRVQRRNGAAYKLAEEVRKKAKQEANIEEVPWINIPPGSEVPDSSRDRGLTEMKRPLHIGISVGHVDGDPGTLGAFVSDYAGKDCILSNNHVLALMGKAKLNDRVCQPTGRDSEGVAQEEIGFLSNYILIGKNRRDSNDAAYAVLDDGIGHESNVVPKGYGFPSEGQMIREVKPVENLLPLLKWNTPVCKIGRTTGFTVGRVTAVALDKVPVETSIGTILFNNVIEVSWESSKKPFTLPGDSGSMVFTKDGFFAIGLHFAGGKKKVGRRSVGISYSCNMANVLRTLRLSLLD